MTIVTSKRLLRHPCRITVTPAYCPERCGVLSIPQVDSDGLIRVRTAYILLSRHGAVIVRDVRVKATIPASLEPDVGIVHGFQMEVIDRAWPPSVGDIAIGHLRDIITLVDVEDVPLMLHQHTNPPISVQILLTEDVSFLA